VVHRVLSKQDSGSPPAAKVCGHSTVDTTMGYAAIYPDEVITLRVPIMSSVLVRRHARIREGVRRVDHVKPRV
jgi:hypothetical protein